MSFGFFYSTTFWKTWREQKLLLYFLTFTKGGQSFYFSYNNRQFGSGFHFSESVSKHFGTILLIRRRQQLEIDNFFAALDLKGTHCFGWTLQAKWIRDSSILSSIYLKPKFDGDFWCFLQIPNLKCFSARRQLAWWAEFLRTGIHAGFFCCASKLFSIRIIFGTYGMYTYWVNFLVEFFGWIFRVNSMGEFFGWIFLEIVWVNFLGKFYGWIFWFNF